MKILQAALLLCLALLIGGCNVVSMAEYDQIESGMTYREVVSIIGEEGTERLSTSVRTSPSSSITTKLYSWFKYDCHVRGRPVSLKSSVRFEVNWLLSYCVIHTELSLGHQPPHPAPIRVVSLSTLAPCAWGMVRMGHEDTRPAVCRPTGRGLW